jgi:hypothetical protein
MLTPAVYSNDVPMVNWEMAEKLFHDHSYYGSHRAKGYHGCVYACVAADTDRVHWYEEVWIGGRAVMRMRGNDLEKLILAVTDKFGYA